MKSLKATRKYGYERIEKTVQGEKKKASNTHGGVEARLKPLELPR